MELKEKIASLAKRRGFVFPSSEIYGGLANTWDFGPMGTLLKNNIRDLWVKTFVTDKDNMVMIDAASILRPEVWGASGHLAGFNEALIDCKECKNRARADHLVENTDLGIKVEGMSFEELEKIVNDNKIKCPKCGKFNWTPIRKFNQLVEVKLGVLEEGKNLAYLRGEIAQGIFLNFKNVIDSTRVKVPFGIAQVGKAYRNEITMGQFVHRSFEFDLMEFEYFIKEEDWSETFKKFSDEMWQFALNLGINESKLRWREHEETERSHYSKKTADIEYEYPYGFKEMFGIAYRTNFDLTNHANNSGKDLSFVDPKTNEKYIPHVIEPTFGLSRLTGIVLFDAYSEIDGRTVLKLNPKIAPYKVAVFPLLGNKPELIDKAREVYLDLKKNISVVWDERGNIGKRYAAQDEIGTPWCITVDFDTEKDNSVTVRDRDTGKQERIEITKLLVYFEEKLK
ncbi:MAG: glycine--tRNA ligase [Microgenomates group bacterium]